MQGRWGKSVLGITLISAIASAAPADAKTTCAYEGGATDLLKIKMTKGGDEATLFVDGAGDELRVATPAAPAGLICGGSGPSTMNTDLIAIKDKSAKGNTEVAIEDPAELAPGASEAGGDFGAGSDEIELEINLGRGRGDLLTLEGTGGADYYHAGTDGLNPNASGGVTLEPGPDADYFPRGVDQTAVELNGDNDVLDAAGNAVVGDPYRRPLEAEGSFGNDLIRGGIADDELAGDFEDDTIEGGFGDDTIDGSFDEDEIEGGFGDDSIRAGSEDDVVDGGYGDDEIDGDADADTIDGGYDDDVIEGGSGDDEIGLQGGIPDEGNDLTIGGTGADTVAEGTGVDTVSYADHPADVLIAIDGGPISGNTTDAFGDDIGSGFEKFIGTDDVADGDEFLGTSEDETFDGGLGPDDFDGEGGEDIVTYAGRTEDVAVSIGSPLGTQGGAGDMNGDDFDSIEGAIGGSGGDSLSVSVLSSAAVTFDGGAGNDELDGGDLDDILIGGRGKDRLFGLSGIDILKAKDGRRDKRIDCGDGANSQEKAKFDQGVDPVPKSC